MFSKEFTTVEKYSLKNNEYVSTYSYMPWQYTSLYDERYKPELSEEVKRKLKLFFQYRFVYSTTVLYDDAKYLKIEHSGDDILSYEIINPFKYNNIANYVPAWKHFSESIECPEIYDCKETIEKMTSVTDELTTFIKSIEYDSDANFTNIMVYDSSYDLDEYTSNHTLNKINGLCASMQKTDDNSVLGIIGVYPNSKKLKIRIVPAYSSYLLEYDTVSRKPTNIVSCDNDFIRDWYIRSLLQYDLITNEDVEYMETLFTPKSRCDFEIVVDENENIEDVYVLVARVYKFQSLA